MDRMSMTLGGRVSEEVRRCFFYHRVTKLSIMYASDLLPKGDDRGSR